MKGVAATIDDLSAALALADAHGLTAEEKRKLKKKVSSPCIGAEAGTARGFSSCHGMCVDDAIPVLRQ